MTWTPLREEPSLSSMKENALASRRVRTQPWRRIESAGCVALRASLTSVRDMEGGGGKGRFMTLAKRKWAAGSWDAPFVMASRPCGGRRSNPSRAGFRNALSSRGPQRRAVAIQLDCFVGPQGLLAMTAGTWRLLRRWCWQWCNDPRPVDVRSPRSHEAFPCPLVCPAPDAFPGPARRRAGIHARRPAGVDGLHVGD